MQPPFGGGGQDRDRRPGRPTGDVAHMAPEAARVIARTLALTCADCTNGGGGSGGRSAHVPDHHLSGLG